MVKRVKKTVVATIHIKIGRDIVGRMPRKRIHLKTDNSGHMTDGRQVVKRRGKWYYRPPK